jgi:hypothetical protein
VHMSVLHMLRFQVQYEKIVEAIKNKSAEEPPS